MKKVKLTKKQLVEEIVENELDNLLSHGYTECLEDFLTNGFRGYKNYSMKELQRLYAEIFDDEPDWMENGSE